LNYAREANICTGLVYIDLVEETSASYAMHIPSPFFGEEMFRPIVYHKFHISYLLQQWKAKLGYMVSIL
jgi:glycogen synthase